MGHIGHLHCEDQDVVRLEEAEVSEKAKPNQKVSSAWFPSNFDKILILRMLNILTKHETADVPHVADDGLGLDQLLDDRPDDDQQVVRADHHVPGQKVKSEQNQNCKGRLLTTS